MAWQETVAWVKSLLAMTFRSFALVVLSALSVAAGCSAQGESSGASSSDVVADGAKDNALSDKTIVKGAITMGASKVAYTGTEVTSPEYLTKDGVPYLGWELADADAASLTIKVQGAFPSTPQILVVDQGFNVLGEAAGAEPVIIPNAAPGKKLVLVRDQEWVRPMDFEISVAQ